MILSCRALFQAGLEPIQTANQKVAGANATSITEKRHGLRFAVLPCAKDWCLLVLPLDYTGSAVGLKQYTYARTSGTGKAPSCRKA